jgi:hypothetical protein
MIYRIFIIVFINRTALKNKLFSLQYLFRSLIVVEHHLSKTIQENDTITQLFFITDWEREVLLQTHTPDGCVPVVEFRTAVNPCCNNMCK